MQQKQRSIDYQEGRTVSRRRFLGSAAGGVAAGAMAIAFPGVARSGNPRDKEDGSGESFFQTRGVVLVPDDMATLDWPLMAKQAGLTTIGTHITPGQVAAFFQTEQGRKFLDRCRTLGISVEHELHAMKDLLPRELFQKDPSMFAMNAKGERIPDYNLCVHSMAAVAIVCENAVKYAKILHSDTGRYFYWIDDGWPMCRCPKCKDLSDTDQAVLLENAMVKALREHDPRATLAHLAYGRTLAAPSQVKPAEHLFLEFAPIHKYEGWVGETSKAAKAKREDWDRKYDEVLDENLKVFGAADAQALEYWLDESAFWREARKADRNVVRVKIPWDQKTFEADLDAYRKRGIRNVTTFAVMIDGKYEAMFGPPPLKEYGLGLQKLRLS